MFIYETDEAGMDVLGSEGAIFSHPQLPTSHPLPTECMNGLSHTHENMQMTKAEP